MKYDNLITELESCGYNVATSEYLGATCLVVTIQVGEHTVELLHFHMQEITALPTFFLKDSASYGVLAHVLTFNDSELGCICVNDQDSVSVNYEKPHLALIESLKRHVSIIAKGISDPVWNKNELLREFRANWEAISSNEEKDLICTSIDGALEEMVIRRPVQGKKTGFDSLYLGLSDSTKDLSEYSYIRLSANSKKRPASKGKGYIIPLQELSPAPSSKEGLGNWYLNAIKSLSVHDKKVFFNTYAQHRDKEFWLVFNALTPSGKTWFCLYFKSSKKKTLPILEGSLHNWNITAVNVQLFNKELIMPRGGANTSLSDKNVLLVGCGSVGSEIAEKVSSSGVGRLILCDPDIFSINNLYRHTLNRTWIGSNKAEALSVDLAFKYPWISAKYLSRTKLLELRRKDYLEGYDLVIVAIGSPTHERLFHDFLVKNKVNVPVINTWVEGYGVGGHATLDIPSSKGCLHCAYVDHNTLGRGLSSNLNFFESDQDVTVNNAGCGELYLPYSAISSAQTALIASDIAIKYLEGKVTISSKVSWKGDDTDARTAGLNMTHRYEKFSKSLIIEPLHDEYCDICQE